MSAPTEVPPDRIVIRYDNPRDAERALKRMRRFGLGIPMDHSAVEAVRLLLLMIPLALAAADVIRFDHAISGYAGYLALRGFNASMKPGILRRFGPRFPLGEFTSAQTIVLDEAGLSSESENVLMRVKWRAVPAPRVFRDGLIIRVAPEASMVLAAPFLPEGVTTEEQARRIGIWRAGADG